MRQSSLVAQKARFDVIAACNSDAEAAAKLGVSTSRISQIRSFAIAMGWESPTWRTDRLREKFESVCRDFQENGKDPAEHADEIAALVGAPKQKLKACFAYSFKHSMQIRRKRLARQALEEYERLSQECGTYLTSTGVYKISPRLERYIRLSIGWQELYRRYGGAKDGKNVIFSRKPPSKENETNGARASASAVRS